MIAGMDYLTGDAAIIMDADLQDPPELIPEMISWWEKGYQDVSAKRRSEQERPSSRMVFPCFLYHITKDVRGPHAAGCGGLPAVGPAVLNALRMLRECQRYTKGLFSWIGFEKKEILFDRQPRAAGKTKWNYWKLMNLAIEGITSFTIAPLRAASFVGCILSFSALAYMLYIVIRTLLHGGDVPGYPSLITFILFIGGVQLLFWESSGSIWAGCLTKANSGPYIWCRMSTGNCADHGEA